MTRNKLELRGAALAVSALCGFLSFAAAPARAEDPTADTNGAFLIGLFNQACVPNRGNPDKIHAWAFDHHLVPITNPQALEIFVGPGEHGIAWQVPSETHQHFALSIRGTTEACVVWAQTANPVFVETAFIKEVEIDGGQRHRGQEERRGNRRHAGGPGQDDFLPGLGHRDEKGLRIHHDHGGACRRSLPGFDSNR